MWSSDSSIYNIKVSSQMGSWNILTNDSFLGLNLTNSDDNITFSVCETTSITFKIGNVKFNMQII